MIAGSEPLAPRIRLRQVCIPATSEGGEGDQGDKEGEKVRDRLVGIRTGMWRV